MLWGKKKSEMRGTDAQRNKKLHSIEVRGMKRMLERAKHRLCAEWSWRKKPARMDMTKYYCKTLNTVFVNQTNKSKLG